MEKDYLTDGLNEPEFVAEMSIAGYSNVRRLADGRWIGTMPMTFTVGLFVGLHRHYYDYRYCYPPDGDWEKAVTLWNGEGHPPGNWIKRKGLGEDLKNPNDDLNECQCKDDDGNPLNQCDECPR